jgi:hypothetical protein
MRRVNAPRQLNLLIIDDKGPPLTWKNLAVHRYSEFADVAEAVAFGLSSADLFIVDVDMESMDVPENLIWANQHAASFGPILGLPFVRPGRPVAFMPYSNHWNRAAMTDGPLMVALALLRSGMTGRPQSLSEAQHWLSRIDSEKYKLSTRIIHDILPSYRETLAKYGELYIEKKRGKFLRNVRRAITSLGTLQYRDQESRVDSGLEIYGTPISIGMVHPERQLDEIEVRSLFADVISMIERDPDGMLSRKQVDVIRRGLELLVKYSEDVEPELLMVASNLLKYCNESEERPRDIRELMDDRAELWVGDHAGDRHWEFRVRRMSMLFAWVRAAWNKDDEIAHLSITDRVRHLLGIHANDPDRRYLQFLTKNNEICAEPFRTPFLKDIAYGEGRTPSVTKAYSLGTKTSYGVKWATPSELALTDGELELCRDYARGELCWEDQPHARWPDWLRPEP